MNARAKSSELATRISDSEYIQASLLIDLIFAAFQKSLFAFHEDRWSAGFKAFRLVVDGKLSGKLGPGEKFLRQALVPVLGSNERFDLAIPDVWKDRRPAHPFIQRFEKSGGWSGSRRRRVDEEVIDLSAIFAGGVEFHSSSASAGIQMADVVAGVVRRAILEPENWQGRLAYDVLRSKLRRIDGTALHLFRLSTGGTDSRGRYRHLSGPTP